jgi:hypothetical protein
MPNSSSAVEAIAREFVGRIEAMVQAQIRDRVLSTLATAMTGRETLAVDRATSEKPDKPLATPKRRRVKLTAQGLAARKLQVLHPIDEHMLKRDELEGQYLGLLRGLGTGARARVQKVAREQGVAAAIKFANTLK